MKFLSAQPDQPYFLWQLQVQLANFHRLGIEGDLIILLATDGAPSVVANLIAANTSAQVHFIPDTRRDKSYAPSVQFHLYSKFFHTHTIGEPYMLIDSDVIFVSLPDMSGLVHDDIVYMSDTRSYIGAQYILSKGGKILENMAAIVGVNPSMIVERQAHSGGAQTIVKGLEDVGFWSKVEADACSLYQYLTIEERKWRGKEYPIQRWTSGMWAFLWNLWREGRDTRITPALDFCWGSDPLTKQKPILHMAGVTPDMSSTHFNKTKFITTHPFDTTHTECRDNMSHVYVSEIQRAREYWNEIRIGTAR